MKPHAHGNEDAHLCRVKAQLEASVNALFGRCPALCGFAVHDEASRTGGAASAFFISEISVFPFADFEARVSLLNDIVSVLSELIDGYPEASELLRERTFARTIH